MIRVQSSTNCLNMGRRSCMFRFVTQLQYLNAQNFAEIQNLKKVQKEYSELVQKLNSTYIAYNVAEEDEHHNPSILLLKKQ